ncbi:beta-ketoacyl-ACP synthase 3 [Micromonospora chersina]|uniref:beta-ketoacyl-ACP synthase 3 n=1 Tax=Micromonospora chersina TaxID=47854 RepID=UPI0033FD4EA5
MTRESRPKTRGAAAVICGMGYWLPPLVVTNAELCAHLDTSEEWITSRTGISTRRRVTTDITTADLATAATERALKSAGGGDVQALVLATTTPDRRCPATAPEVAARLGLGSIAAFDVSAVCSGFLYALATGEGLLATGLAQRVVVVAAESFSVLLDPNDRTTMPIFGDGGGAVVLRQGSPDEPGALGDIVLGSDGTRSDMIRVGAAGRRGALEHRPGSGATQYFQMAGREVFRHAVERMSAAATAAMASAGWSLEDVDRFYAHQANARITSAVGHELGIPADRLAGNIRDVGNTAAASLPILLAQTAASGFLVPGHRVVMSAFGGGLTWGATTVIWPDIEIVTD